MIQNESSGLPADLHFDVAICSVGYEKRSRWVAEKFKITADKKFAVEFGFLRECSYQDNREFYSESQWKLLDGREEETFRLVSEVVAEIAAHRTCTVFVDISSMSREMMARFAVSLYDASIRGPIKLSASYAPSAYIGDYSQAPIRFAAPVIPQLAGWSSRPERPLGVIIGLGCEPGLALGALQMLEPSKAWLYVPEGFDTRFVASLARSNENIVDIFDATEISYEVGDPLTTRGRIEALVRAVDHNFRLICVPFGPKIFSWLSLSTIVFQDYRRIGLWSFSSRENAVAIDREVSGEVVWHTSQIVAAND